MFLLGATAPPEILIDFVIILAVAVGVTFLLRRLKIPVIVGFILAGIFVGPGCLGIVKGQESIEVLAEIGVILLLFSVGLHLSIKDLVAIKNTVFFLGGLQVIVTISIVTLFAKVVLGVATAQAIFWGILIALSSTALVINLLERRKELATSQGRGILGVLLFQDLAVVPIMLAIPLLAGTDDKGLSSSIGVLFKSFSVLCIVVVGAYFIFPHLMRQVAKTRSRELFTLSVLLVVFGTALILGAFGLSMALGAFLAGIVISESEYSNQIQSDLMPFKDSFTGLFFISIGLLVNPQLWFKMPLTIIGLILEILLVKVLVVFVVGLFNKKGQRISWLMALGLAQVGEFSFVVANTGMGEYQLMTEGMYQIFLAVSVPTMILTPVMMNIGKWSVYNLKIFTRLPDRKIRSLAPSEKKERKLKVSERIKQLEDHVIIVGYGPTGKSVTKVLMQLEIDFVIIELNVKTVEEERTKGKLIIYGDAIRESILKFVRINSARALIIASDGKMSTNQIVANARRLNETLYIVARTRFSKESKSLKNLGANEVIVEEYQTALTMAGTVMSAYGASEDAIDTHLETIQEEGYELLTTSGEFHDYDKFKTMKDILSGQNLFEISISELSSVIGKRINEINLRSNANMTIIGINRENKTIMNPQADEEFQVNDKLILFGTEQEFKKAEIVFN